MIAFVGRLLGWLLIGPSVFEEIDFDGLDEAIREQGERYT